jgi:hypothetical protein
MASFELPRLQAFAAARDAAAAMPQRADQPGLRIKRLAQGLRSEVALVSPEPGEASRVGRPFVVKHLEGDGRREVDVYRALGDRGIDLLPRMLGEDPIDSDHSYLYLEYVRRNESWPWRNVACSKLVLRELARLHACDATRLALPPLDVESHLRVSAASTLELAESVSAAGGGWLRPWLRHLRVVVQALPQMRRLLFEHESVVVHGDVHSANVHLSRRDGADRVVLLDWSHARIGCGLEDVSSWLQSLALWEPSARRHHDLLLKAYRSARGDEPALTPAFRSRYWLAGGSNALAGALRYHLWVADPASGHTPRRQADSKRSALHWLRVVRRAAVCWQQR